MDHHLDFPRNPFLFGVIWEENFQESSVWAMDSVLAALAMLL